MITKTIKVTNKGQISIPNSIREVVGINKGDELLIIEYNGKILIEKVEIIAEKIKDSFSDFNKIGEESLKEVWDNDSDKIWDSYLKNEN
ncbi:MAG: AbrB/MazE/SpoVT family DNA-binding domain-containing protein [Nanoarchaeota archaeon]|nr:AbrB/MazE/SpoVT family DNA-binding domain-containing protein [Nanoarchaeota archaeon]